MFCRGMLKIADHNFFFAVVLVLPWYVEDTGCLMGGLPADGFLPLVWVLNPYTHVHLWLSMGACTEYLLIVVNNA